MQGVYIIDLDDKTVTHRFSGDIAKFPASFKDPLGRVVIENNWSELQAAVHEMGTSNQFNCITVLPTQTVSEEEQQVATASWKSLNISHMRRIPLGPYPVKAVKVEASQAASSSAGTLAIGGISGGISVGNLIVESAKGQDLDESLFAPLARKK